MACAVPGSVSDALGTVGVGGLVLELNRQDGSSEGRPLVKVIGSLEDEVQALMLGDPRARELALVYTKLQEARHWATEYGARIGSHVIIDKRDYADVTT